MKSTNPAQRIWMLSAVLAGIGGAALILVEFPLVETPVVFSWWLLIPAFVLTEVLVIHLPTRRGAHTVSVSEIPFVIGLAFVTPTLFIAARMAGAVFAWAFYRRQAPLRLAFNSSMLLVETIAGALVYHAVLGDSLPIDPRGWLAGLLALTVSTSIGGSLVSLAISQYEPTTNLRDRGRDVVAGSAFSLGSGVFAILGVFLIWHDVRAVLLLALAAVPILFALRVFERLARRHDELGIAYALTKELEQAHVGDEVAMASLRRVVEVLNPAAAAVLMRGRPPVLWVDDDETTSDELDPEWEAILDVHVQICADGIVCACAQQMMGARWAQGRVYRLMVGEEVGGTMMIHSRTGAGTEISASDHGMLEAIAAQLSSALTRIEAVTRLEREIEEKKALVRSKDQLIAAVSHELRTPLTGIIGFAELLADSEIELAPSEAESAKLHIATEAQDLGNIVEDLLTAARADLGALEVQAKPVSAHQAIDRVISNLRVDRLIAVTGPECWMSADAPRVRQILRNLVSNATKYGGESVGVAVDPVDHDVVVRVVDDGGGVPPDRVGSIFEPYESAHHEPSQPGSLGLGLSISRTLARLMGGDLTYHRIDGSTEFRLTLPAVAPAIGDQPATESPSPRLVP